MHTKIRCYFIQQKQLIRQNVCTEVNLDIDGNNGKPYILIAMYVCTAS